MARKTFDAKLAEIHSIMKGMNYAQRAHVADQILADLVYDSPDFKSVEAAAFHVRTAANRAIERANVVVQDAMDRESK